MTKVETGVMGATPTAEIPQARNLLPVSEYSLADLFANINPQDAEFLKYVPDCFFHGAHPLRVRIPRTEKESTT